MSASIRLTVTVSDGVLQRINSLLNADEMETVSSFIRHALLKELKLREADISYAQQEAYDLPQKANDVHVAPQPTSPAPSSRVPHYASLEEVDADIPTFLRRKTPNI